MHARLHYKSHTIYDIWNQRSYRSPVDVTRTVKLKPTSRESENTVVAELNSTLAGGIDAPDEAARVEDAVDIGSRSKEASQRSTTTTVNSQTGTLDVGRSTDLYAELPQVYVGRLSRSVGLLGASLGKSAGFLCLPNSQMPCLISIPSPNVIFSTVRLSEESFKDADGKPVNRFSIPVYLVDDIILGDLVSVCGLNFHMSVFHTYGGGIGGGRQPHPEADGTSPGDSLTHKVHDIGLHISRTLQTNIVGQQSQTSQLLPRPSSSSSMTTATDVRAATTTLTNYVTASYGTNSISLHNIVRFSERKPTDTTEQPKSETVTIVCKSHPMTPSAPADISLANWLQKGPRLSKALLNGYQGEDEKQPPGEGLDSDVPTQSVSTSTIPPPPPQHGSDTADRFMASRPYILPRHTEKVIKAKKTKEAKGQEIYELLPKGAKGKAKSEVADLPEICKRKQSFVAIRAQKKNPLDP
nr:hypothetical protein HmN_000677600 [Hymenolepis microstoma]